MPILLKVTGRTIVSSLFAYATDIYPNDVTPIGIVTPVSIVSRRLILPIELMPVNMANSWNGPDIAELLNLTVPKGLYLGDCILWKTNHNVPGTHQFHRSYEHIQYLPRVLEPC